jgi:hypothetical protein
VAFRESSNVGKCICSFSVHAIQMGEKVTSIFEHAINVFGRKDDILKTTYLSYLGTYIIMYGIKVMCTLGHCI